MEKVDNNWPLRRHLGPARPARLQFPILPDGRNFGTRFPRSPRGSSITGERPTASVASRTEFVPWSLHQRGIWDLGSIGQQEGWLAADPQNMEGSRPIHHFWERVQAL